MRTLIALLGFVSALFLHPLLTALCIFFLAFRYASWEAILLGCMTDLIWQPSSISFPYFTLAAILIVWVLGPLRSQFLR